MWRAYSIDDPGSLTLLAEAAAAWDRAHAARLHIKKHGAVQPGRENGFKVNPSCNVERDARTALLRALTLLGIPESPDPPPRGRPAGAYTGRNR